jgi:hypothetical protein
MKPTGAALGSRTRFAPFTRFALAAPVVLSVLACGAASDPVATPRTTVRQDPPLREPAQRSDGYSNTREPVGSRRGGK